MDDPGGNKMLLVMDYMEGGPVLTREGLERGRRILEPLALQYFRDMCKVCCLCARGAFLGEACTCDSTVSVHNQGMKQLAALQLEKMTQELYSASGPSSFWP